ncbi:unnamed protein product [Cylindrotheca closterium]|uniref:procollagen-lysine 5-dioxygenase n=1 Tax=Cylindrotheca closterium TaxID=2856 RepID=A0AAD2PWU1_9STRA|nr:unnamed protein product [Cylindrotheca closterium]
MTSTESSSTSESSNENILKGWSPLTSRLLSGQVNDKSCAWDVLDGNFGDPFVNGLWKEIEGAKLVEKLVPARTKGESSILANMMLAMSSSNDHGTSQPQKTGTVRGDKSLFLSREYRKKAEFATKHPHMHQLITTITNTILHKLGERITLDTSMTSVQLAVYPGDGTSGYTRHCDRGQTSCMAESQSSSSSASSRQGPASPQSPPKAAEAERIITAIYYLTNDDWDPVLDGGCLRVFSNGSLDKTDICPYRDRLILFRSDGVEHEVLPSLRRSRTAITIWFYGHHDILLGASNGTNSKLSNQVETKDIATKGEDASANKRPVPEEVVSNILPPLPLVKKTSETTDSSSTCLPSIFVSIASYRDSEICPTLDSLFSNARHPDRIFVGAVLQNDATYDQENVRMTQKYVNHSNVRCLELAAKHALGPCYARSLAQSLHRGETFVLQIDSHMRFRTNWDDYLIGLWEQTTNKGCHERVVLTAYPVGYELPNKIPNEERGTLLVPWKFDENGMLRQRGRLLKKDSGSTEHPPPRATPCHLYAAGFNFGPASMIQDVPYDPKLDFLFFGEELSMAVRLYTHGYDLYAPPVSVLYHLWSRAHRPTLQSSPSSVAPEKIEEKREESRKKVQQQLLGQASAGIYGLGDKRSAEDFAKALHVDFHNSIVHEGASDGGLSNDRFVNTADAASLFAEDSVERKIATLDTKTQELISFFLSGMDLDQTK